MGSLSPFLVCFLGASFFFFLSVFLPLFLPLSGFDERTHRKPLKPWLLLLFLPYFSLFCLLILVVDVLLLSAPLSLPPFRSGFDWEDGTPPITILTAEAAQAAAAMRANRPNSPFLFNDPHQRADRGGELIHRAQQLVEMLKVGNSKSVRKSTGRTKNEEDRRNEEIGQERIEADDDASQRAFDLGIPKRCFLFS